MASLVCVISAVPSPEDICGYHRHHPRIPVTQSPQETGIKITPSPKSCTAHNYIAFNASQLQHSTPHRRCSDKKVCGRLHNLPHTFLSEHLLPPFPRRNCTLTILWKGSFFIKRSVEACCFLISLSATSPGRRRFFWPKTACLLVFANRSLRTAASDFPASSREPRCSREPRLRRSWEPRCSCSTPARSARLFFFFSPR